MPQKASIKTGSILLAEPFMVEPIFNRSVILITDHSHEDGSVGFILNKPTTYKIHEIIDDFPEMDSLVFQGGPVAMESLNYIHDCGNILDDSELIGSNVSWGGDFDKLKFLIKNELIKPQNIRFFAGYSGWSQGQLKDEIDGGSWMITEMDPNFALKMSPESLWKEVVNLKGGCYEIIAQMPPEWAFLN